MPRAKRLVTICPNKCHTVMKKRPVANNGNRAFFSACLPVAQKNGSRCEKTLAKICIIYYNYILY